MPPAREPLRSSTPVNETARLEALRRYMVLDTEPEPAFDRITALVARLLDVPMAAVSLVDSDRTWFKSCVGLGMQEAPRDDSFCTYAILSAEPTVVEDATRDQRFAANPFVAGEGHIRFYAGVPLLTHDGYCLGTLCVVDVEPRRVTASELATLTDLAKVVLDLLEARLAYHARQLFERVTELSPDVIYVFDLQQQKNVYGNRQVTEVLGYTPESAGAAILPQLLHPDDLPRVAEHLQRFVGVGDGVQAEISYRVRDVKGHYRWFRAKETVFARGADGAPTQILGVATDISSLKEAEQQLAELARTDELTGLPNVRSLRDRLLQLGHESNRGRRFALALVDIDHFKKVNDVHGHHVGDQVLVAIARALRSGVRATDFVARAGGEEFVVIFTDVDEPVGCALADTLRRRVAATDDPVAVTCSIGICHNTLSHDTATQMKAADAALYAAKAAGRDRVYRYGAAGTPEPAPASASGVISHRAIRPAAGMERVRR